MLTRTSLLLSSAVLGLCVVLTGCGAGSSSTSHPQPMASNLSGNWLLAGTISPGTAQGSGSVFGLTATFNVTGTKVTGVVSGSFACDSFGALVIPITAVSGNVVADGTFTLLTPVAAGGLTATVTLKGQVPSTADGAWTGTYTIANSASACPGSMAGDIAATPVPLLDGAYSGTASLNAVDSSVSKQVGVTATLRQGGTAPGGVATNLVLTGTLAVQGSPCLTSGSIETSTSPPSFGFVEGNAIAATFAMNDGSVVLMVGRISATDASKLSVEFVSSATGSCGEQLVAFEPITLEM